MRTYRVVNLAPVLRSPRMGQVREFEVLSDQVLARICMAVDAYNDADTSWSSPDAAAGERTQRDSTATIQGVINGVPPGLKNAAIWEIRKYCDGADAVLDTVVKPGPGTTPAIPPSQDTVASVDPNRPPPGPPPPPPPNTNPPVISEDKYHRWPKPTPPPQPYAPVASGDRYIPQDIPEEPGPISFPPPVATGSESPQPEPPQPPPPPPPYRPPPSVATPSVGCWYVMGKGYMWGERPSGGESTGLNQKDCEDLKARDLEVRTGNVQPSQSQVQDMTQNPYSWNAAAGVPASVATGACDTSKGEFPDGHGGCRRSVSTMPGLPGGFGDSGMTAPTSFSDFNPGDVSATSFMGGRRVALRGVHGNGNLEWWSYQQAFLPPLFFAKRRTRYATLGAGKPVPPGLCCQATDDGGAICSDGHGFPPTCPNKPEPNVPGVAQRINQDGYMVPKPPPAPVNGVCAAAGASEKKADEGGGVPPLLGIAAVGALIYALVESL